MVTEVTDQEPVLVLNDKKYIISDLSQEAQYCVNQLNVIQSSITTTSAELDRHQMAYQGFTAKLSTLVEPNTEDSATAE